MSWKTNLNKPLTLLLLVTLAVGCKVEGESGASGGEAGASGGGGGTPVGGLAGGAAGGSLEPMRTLAEDRCEGARSKVQVLALYHDRLAAFKEDELGWEVEHYCPFLLFSEEGVIDARGIAQSPEGGFTVVYHVAEAGGGLLMYDNNGVFIRQVEPNINLANPGGIWWVEEGYVVWSASSKNLYKLDAEGNFINTYTPPMQTSARLNNLTDMVFIGRDEEDNPRLLATFSDRAPQLFAFPDSPSFNQMEVKGAWAITLVDTQIGDKVVFSGEVDGLSGGVAQYRPINSGRMTPNLDDVIIFETDDGYGNGADITPIYNNEGEHQGFFILDTSEETGPQISSFNSFGILQEKTSLEAHGAPMAIMRTRIFKDL